jgi:hypothetical protein
MRNKPVHINGSVNKGIALLAKYLPDSIALSIVKGQSRSIRAQ